MTQEEKDLLLKDLCARLPYGVFVNAKSIGLDGEIFEINVRYGMLRIAKDICTGESELVPIFDVKPYLRPMSCMTKEEKKELENFVAAGMFASQNKDPLFQLTREALLAEFFNKHHIDYCGLIPMGLALEAKEGMYEIK